MKKRSDLSWSLCHEYPTLYDHCKPIIEKAAECGVHRIELCGVTQSDVGNADAYVHFNSHSHCSGEEQGAC